MLFVGVIGTDIMRNMQENILGIRVLYFLFGWLYRFVVKTPFNGAQTTIFCALDKDIENKSGAYFSDCEEKHPNPKAEILEDQERLWTLSEKLVGLKSETNNKGMLYKSLTQFL